MATNLFFYFQFPFHVHSYNTNFDAPDAHSTNDVFSVMLKLINLEIQNIAKTEKEQKKTTKKNSIP
jgi:hypothetical protein